MKLFPVVWTFGVLGPVGLGFCICLLEEVGVFVFLGFGLGFCFP